MTAMREAMGLTLREAARKAKVSTLLLGSLEDGTYPTTTAKCMATIGTVYGLTRKQRACLTCKPVTGKVAYPTVRHGGAAGGRG